MFELEKHRTTCERLLSQRLNAPVQLIGAKKLKKSTRKSPWRLDALVGEKRKSFVLQSGDTSIEYEYKILRLLEDHPLPTPRVIIMDMSGDELGFPFGIREHIAGVSLRASMQNGNNWAETLYFDAIDVMHSITETLQVNETVAIETVSIQSILQDTFDYFFELQNPLAERMYQSLVKTIPSLPKEKFSNGDLWLDNFRIKDRKLAGIIDFQHASFSDPVYEFMLSFFVEPSLRGRGIEERFCHHIGVDPQHIIWYHGLELFETYGWVCRSGKPFVHHTKKNLEIEIKEWLMGHHDEID